MEQDNHNSEYYLKCMVGGMLACGLTHLAIVPLDVIKCKNQIDKLYCRNIREGIRKISLSHQVTLGWVPTLIGYSLQGSGKFGFYEIFKDIFKKIAGEEKSCQYRKFGWLVASASAEFLADLFLSPWEAIKLKIQLSRPGFIYPNKLAGAFHKLIHDEGKGSLYRGIVPLWSRQIPYTVVKFVAFEEFVEFFYEKVFLEPKKTYSKTIQLSIIFTSGFLAGVLCAIVSHPADTILSKIYSKEKAEGSMMKQMKEIYLEIGFKGLWRGLLTRIVMIGTIAGFQWWIYDSFKSCIGLETTGGMNKRRE